MEKLNILQIMPRWRMAVLLAVVALVGIRVCGEGLPAPVYPVVHDRQWYEERNFIYQWTDERGISHYSNLLETATNPHQIEAMLKYVYTNPEIPGLLYAIPDSAGRENIYPYMLSRADFPNYNFRADFDKGRADGSWTRTTWEDIPIRANNLSTIIDYERHVDTHNFTGDIPQGDSRWDFENGLNAGTNGQGAWGLGLCGGQARVPQPNEHGLTVFLVKMKDTYEYTADGKPVHTYSSGTPKTTPTPLTLAITDEIESVTLLTNFVRIEDFERDATSRQRIMTDDYMDNHNSGTLYSVSDDNINRFYFIAKGTPRQSVKMPTKPLFEEFSPIGSLDNAMEGDFYRELMGGKTYTMKHDCSSVPEQAHAFSTHGLLKYQSADRRKIKGMALWIPDYRMEYWTWGGPNDYSPRPGDVTSREGLGRDNFKMYVSKNDGTPNENSRVYRVIRYFNYNPQHMPTLALYTCQLKASTKPISGWDGTIEEKRKYDVTLDWTTTVSKIASGNLIPEDFEVYEVVNGVRSAEPLFTFTYGSDGYCTVNHMDSDPVQASPATKYREYQHTYPVQQYEDHGYWLNYQVYARVHKKEGVPESFEPVLSNIDRVWIPPLEVPSPIQMRAEAHTSSAYDPVREVNRYVNTIRITNNPQKPIMVSRIHDRNDDMTYYEDEGHYGPYDPNNPDHPKWVDDGHGSEIIVYRYDRLNPAEKTQIAQIYFHGTNETSDLAPSVAGKTYNEFHRFDVRIPEGNQAENAQDGEYVYKKGGTYPWTQRTITTYAVPASANEAAAAAALATVRDATPLSFKSYGYPLGLADGAKDVGGANTLYDGLMITDVFEESTKFNDHPDHYDYIAEFHQYANPDGNKYPESTCYSNEVMVDVYKTISESAEHTFTKDEVDADTSHGLELGYEAGLTVTNMQYLPEVARYDLKSRESESSSVGDVDSYAEKDTPSNYLVFSQRQRVSEPDANQTMINIPDRSRQASLITHQDYVPVLTANLIKRAEWILGQEATIEESTYGSNYHGTDNTKVELKKDPYHPEYEEIITELGGVYEISDDPTWAEHSPVGYGSDDNFYGYFMTVESDMSRDVEVYGVRVWRTRASDHEGKPEDVLVNEWFAGDEKPALDMPKSCYFIPTLKEGKLQVAMKDAFRGPDMYTYQNSADVRPTYIVRFYGRLKEGASPRRAPRHAPGDATALVKTYYVSESQLTADAEDRIVTAVDRLAIGGEVVSVRYYDTMGHESDRPFDGVNIIITTLADGTRLTHKEFNHSESR